MKIIISFILCLFCFVAYPKDSTYQKNGTTYYYNKTYKSTGLPMVKRNPKAKKEFLKQLGLKKTPKDYEIDHIIPLHQGGTDTPDNMQLLHKDEHKKKTAQERKGLPNKKG